MAEQIQFETPENVQVSYPVAGLGTRFIAWLIDSILLGIIMVILIVIALIGGMASEKMMRDLAESMRRGNGQAPEIPLYIMGLAIAVFGLGNFLYYGISEYFMGGQTIGKRQVSLRVVKTNGFSLDAGSIMIRNIFRIIDHFPVTWIIPVLSKKSQRLGDMVGGTIVIRDEKKNVSTLRERLLEQNAADATFHFSGAQLEKARATDFEASEKLLERWASLDKVQREQLLQAVCEAIARRLQTSMPDANQRLHFLEDLLAAEYRRQYRNLH